MKPPQIAVRLIDWSLASDGEVTETATSWLLPVAFSGGKAMLKVLKPESDEGSGIALLRYWDGAGAVRLYRSETDALLMERVEGKVSLVHMAVSGQDDLAAEALAKVFAKLHRRRDRPMPRNLVPLEVWFSALTDRDPANALLGCCRDVARRLLSEERNTVPLHGDLHHANVLDGGMRGWLAIDPKGLIGEGCYDIANLLRNPLPYGNLVHNSDRMAGLAQLYGERLSLDPQRILDFAFAHAGLSVCWDLEEGQDPSFGLSCVEALWGLVRP